MNDVDVRMSGPLAPCDAVRDALLVVLAAEHWLTRDDPSRALVVPACALELSEVAAAERALGATIPDDVLALLATPLRVVRDRWAARLSAVVSHTLDARELGLSSAFVAFGRRDARFVCWERHGPKGTQPWITIYASQDRSSHRLRLAEWIYGHVGGVLDDLEVGEDALDALVTAEVRSAFAPVLQACASDSSFGRRARIATHPRFGRGVVVEALAGDKLVILFEGAGQRTVLKRFVVLDDG